MIEFAILFGLGFLTASFLAFLIAPAIHRRIVWFTERRLKATMPLSPQEVRAQKDMVRALYAAENAKTTQDLVHEREKSVALQLRHDTLALEASRLASENSDLQTQINDMNVEASDLRSRLRREESYISQLKTSLHTAEQASLAKEADIDALKKRLNKMSADADNIRIDMATRETEIESLKFRANALRDERDTLRQDVNLLTKRAKEAETRLTQAENKALRLEEKLSLENAASTDKDSLIERRTQEIGKLKEKIKAANAEARDATRALRNAGLKPVSFSKTVHNVKSSNVSVFGNGKDTELTIEARAKVESGISRLTEELRNRSMALTEQLLHARTPAHENALREEIAAIAADMVVLTALKEGASSPIYDFLPENIEIGQSERQSLAERAAYILSELKAETVSSEAAGSR
ncbi:MULTISPECIES: hypothetical protein [unclassified Sinorhizobium]|uniref:hypothetical protein n=1 Tax=unclassified Sinorhizobium TaxID=2613772 RepID=UPI003523B51E